MEKRKSNYELLRILAMVMIVAYHYVIHGNFESVLSREGGARMTLEIISMLGKAGVNFYCLLMGYFGVRQSYSVKKLVRIYLQVVFYTWTALIVAACFNLSSLSLRVMAGSLLPVITEHYWFMTAWVVVYLLSPYLNNFRKLEKKKQTQLIILIYVIWGIIPVCTLNAAAGMFSNQLVWFIVMYITGAYMRENKPRYKRYIYFNLSILGIMLLGGVILLLNLLGRQFSPFLNYTSYFRWSNSPFVVLFCISFFRTITMTEIKYSRGINYFAKCSLGVYLFHENKIIRPVLWKILGRYNENIIYLILSALASVIIVFLLGILFETIRQFIFKYVLEQWIDNISKSMSKLANNIMEKINTLWKYV